MCAGSLALRYETVAGIRQFHLSRILERQRDETTLEDVATYALIIVLRAEGRGAPHCTERGVMGGSDEVMRKV